MKEKILKIFKNKFNITLIILQVLALFCYFMAGLWQGFAVIFFVLEGVFLIVWGIKIFADIKKIDDNHEILGQLPFTEEEKKNILKTDLRVKKNNRLVAIILIILGTVLVFSVFNIF